MVTQNDVLATNDLFANPEHVSDLFAPAPDLAIDGLPAGVELVETGEADRQDVLVPGIQEAVVSQESPPDASPSQPDTETEPPGDESPDDRPLSRRIERDIRAAIRGDEDAYNALSSRYRRIVRDARNLAGQQTVDPYQQTAQVYDAMLAELAPRADDDVYDTGTKARRLQELAQADPQRYKLWMDVAAYKAAKGIDPYASYASLYAQYQREALAQESTQLDPDEAVDALSQEPDWGLLSEQDRAALDPDAPAYRNLAPLEKVRRIEREYGARVAIAKANAKTRPVVSAAARLDAQAQAARNGAGRSLPSAQGTPVTPSDYTALRSRYINGMLNGTLTSDEAEAFLHADRARQGNDGGWSFL